MYIFTVDRLKMIALSFFCVIKIRFEKNIINIISTEGNMKKFITTALTSLGAVAAMTCFSGGAQAQSFQEVRQGNRAGPIERLPANCGSEYFSYFSTGMRNNNSTLFTDFACARTTIRHAHTRMRWNGDGSSDDYVVGAGWAPTAANKSRSITFNVRGFSASATSPGGRGAPQDTPQVATMGVYGWLCPTRTEVPGRNTITMREYYVVDGWYQRNAGPNGTGTFPSSFRPFGTSFEGSGLINGTRYDYYSSGVLNRGNGCRGGNAPFRQIWAVRRTEKNRGQRTISMNTFFNFWNNGNGSDVGASAPSGYQIVGVEGIGATRGSMDVVIF
jgi:hypothetical protein